MRLLKKINNSTENNKEILPAIKEALINDLNLNRFAESISLVGSKNQKADKLINMMTDNPDEIHYRQQLSRNLYENSGLYDDLYRIYQKLLGLQDVAANYTQTANKSVSNYVKVVKWLDLFCTLVTDFVACFEVHNDVIDSESLLELRVKVMEINESEEFKILLDNIKVMKTDSHKLNSAIIGVNLNSYMEPVSVNCLEIKKYYFFPRKIADFKKSNGKAHGIGKFKYHPAGKMKQGDLRYDEMRAPALLADTNKIQRMISCEINIEYIKGLDSFLKSLNFNSSGIVKKYILNKITEILEITDDLGFFLGGIKMIKQLAEKGMPVSLPTISSETNGYAVKGLYNCYLPFILENPSDNIVKNDLTLDDEYNFAILNGPNKGGKTTFIQAFCLSIIMFQLGLYAPCSEAKIYPVDLILTHYQKEEKGSRTGRLAAEADFVRKIFSCATERSLVILNEPYVSTSPAEGRFLILNILSGVRELGFRGLLVTHYHKLNDMVEEANSATINKIAFLNMGIDSDLGKSRRTYELRKGRGEVKSFAMDILREYAPELLENTKI